MVLPHDEMARWAVDRLLMSTPAAPLRMKLDCEMVERASVSEPRPI